MGERPIRKAGLEFRVLAGEDGRHDTFWDWYESETWEPDTLAAFRACIRPGTPVADVGAWIGPTTLLAAAMGATVTALEPDPVAANVLERNLALNPELETRVTLLRTAVGASDGTATLISSSTGGDSLSYLRFGEEAAATAWEVPVLGIESLLRLPGAGPPAFLKLDAEGAEYATVPAMRDYIRERRPSIYVSAHPNLLYDRTTVARRIRTGAAALRANRRLLATLATYRHHYVYADGSFRDVRGRNLVRALLPLPIRTSLLVGSCLFTDEAAVE